MARTSDRFSTGEFSALLDEDSNGHLLAEYFLKQKGGPMGPRSTFLNCKSKRFSIDIRTELVKSPSDNEEQPSDNEEQQNEIAAEHEKSRATSSDGEILQEESACREQPALECVQQSAVDNYQSKAVVMSEPDIQTDQLKSATSNEKIHQIKAAEDCHPVANAREGSVNIRMQRDDAISSNHIPLECVAESAVVQNGPEYLDQTDDVDANVNPKVNEHHQENHIAAAVSAVAPQAVALQSQLTEHSPSASRCFSPSRRTGVLPSADRLRRFSLKRLSNTGGRRTLLNEFESTVTDSNFIPPMFSTPLTPSATLSKKKICNSVLSPSPLRQSQNTEGMLLSLRRHDEVLNDVMEFVAKTTRNEEKGQVALEKENHLGNLPTSPQPGLSNCSSRLSTRTSVGCPTYIVEKDLRQNKAVFAYERPATPVEEAVYLLHTNTETKAECNKYIGKKSRIPRFTPGKVQCKMNDSEVNTSGKEANHNLAELPEIPETVMEPDEDVEIPETQDLLTGPQEAVKTAMLAKARDIELRPGRQSLKPDKVSPNENEQLATEETPNANRIMESINKTKDKSTKNINRALPQSESSTPQKVCDVNDVRLGDILTDDEDMSETCGTRRDSNATVGTCMESSSCPLNLAAIKTADSHRANSTRSRRLRKRSSSRRSAKLLPTLSPVLSTETEAEMGPPRAHAAITRRTRALQRRKIPLNAAPRTPINGERFAVELKTHLARLKNHEILDLRKRNSLGKAFPISLGKDFHSSRRSISSLAAKQLLEEELQHEMVKRNLEKCDENELLQGLSVETEETEQTPQEQHGDIWLHEIPPAPAAFRDISSQSVAEPPQQQMQSEPLLHKSLFMDDTSNENVTFLPKNCWNSMANKSRQRSRRCKKIVPEVLQKYLDIQSQLGKNKLCVNNTKRNLYSLAVQQSKLDETRDNNSTFKSAKSRKQHVLRASDQQNNSPQESPAPCSAEEIPAKGVASSMAGSSALNDSDKHFKKPEVPKAKSKKKTSGRKHTDAKQTSAVASVVGNSEQTAMTASNDDISDTNTNNESESLRRSKRGHKPLQNYWSFRSTDPTPLYDIGLFYKKREEEKHRRIMRSNTSKSSMASEATLPTASGTAINNKINKNGANKQRKRGRPQIKTTHLGERDSSSASTLFSSDIGTGHPNGLSVITESDSHEGRVSEPAQKKSLCENMFHNLDEVDISSTQTHKVSRTPRNYIHRITKQALENNDTPKTTVVKDKTRKKTANTTTTEGNTKTKDDPDKQQRKKKTTGYASKVVRTKESAIKNKQKELQMDPVSEPSAEPLCSIAVSSSTAAHINNVFDQLKNAPVHATPVQCLAKAPKITSEKNLIVRLPKLKKTILHKTSSSATAMSSSSSVGVNCKQIATVSSNDTTVTKNSTQTAMDTDCNTDVPSWLKDISHVGSKILRNTDKEKKIFEEMHCSIPGNLVLTQVDGLDYAYYENDKEVPFGYIRFKPKQVKRVKTARTFHLTFFVLSGIFKVCTNKDQADFGEGAVITIHIGSRYSIENLTDKMAILMVFKKKCS